MGLAIKNENEKYCPVLTCDKCGQPIENMELAIAQYTRIQKGLISQVKIYHKGECDPKKEYWQSLRFYIPWLLCNMKWGMKKHTNKGDTLTIEVPEPLGD